MRIIRVFNRSGGDSTWLGQLIENDDFIELSENEATTWAGNNLVVQDVANGNLTVSDGTTEFTGAAEGLNWLSGNVQPPRTSEGFWSVTNKAESLLDGNQTVNWVSNRFLDSLSEYNETFIIPENKTFIFTLFGTDSPNVSVFSTIEFYQYLDGEYYRISPNIDPFNVWVFKSTTSADSSIGTVAISANPFIDIYNLPVSSIYAVTPVSGLNTVKGYIKINEIDASASHIHFSAFASFDFEPEARIGLVDRYIVALGTNSNTATVTYYSPLTFTGNGRNFLKLTVRNTHSTDAGFAGAAVNGFLKPTGNS